MLRTDRTWAGTAACVDCGATFERQQRNHVRCAPCGRKANRKSARDWNWSHREQIKAARSAAPPEHTLCPCGSGRIVPLFAEYCWSCEDKSPIFEELDRRIADGEKPLPGWRKYESRRKQDEPAGQDRFLGACGGSGRIEQGADGGNMGGGRSDGL